MRASSVRSINRDALSRAGFEAVVRHGMRAGVLGNPVDSAAAVSKMQLAISNLLPCDGARAGKHKDARTKIETIPGMTLRVRAVRVKSLLA